MSRGLTKAQVNFLKILDPSGRGLDRRETLTQQQWAMAGRLAALGLVTQSMFHVSITPAGRAALNSEGTAR